MARIKWDEKTKNIGKELLIKFYNRELSRYGLENRFRREVGKFASFPTIEKKVNEANG